MASVIVDRVSGVISFSIAMKAPCLAASTTNLTLSASATATTIDAVTISTGNRILVWNQTDNTQNGIYDVQSSAWTRAIDFNAAGQSTRGTLVFVSTGATHGPALFYLSSTGINVPDGSSAISFTKLP